MYAARALPEENISVEKNVSRPSALNSVALSNRVNVGSAAETIGEERNVAATSRHDWEGADVVDADGSTGPFQEGHRDYGAPDRQPLNSPCLTLQVVAKPPPGADTHIILPVQTFEHSQSALGAEVPGNFRMISLHDPRAHEQRHVNAKRPIVQQRSRASIGRRQRGGGWGVD